MSDAGGAGGGDDDDYNVLDDIDQLTVDPELQEGNIESVSFDWCETVARVGEKYWKNDGETDLIELSTELGLPKQDVRRAARTYYCIYDIPTEDLEGVATGAVEVMTRYFREHESVEEIAADQESDNEEVRRWAREYLGGVERTGSIDDVDLGTLDELPSPPSMFTERIWESNSFVCEGLQELGVAGQQFEEIQETFQSSEWQKAAKAAQNATIPDSLATILAEQRKSFAPAVDAVRSNSTATRFTMPYLPLDVVDSAAVSFSEYNYPFHALDSPAIGAISAIEAMDLSRYVPMFESLRTGTEAARTIMQFTEELEQIAYLVNTGVVSPAGASPTGAASPQIPSTHSKPTVDAETPSHPFADLLFSLKRADPSAFNPVVPEQPELEIDRESLEDLVEYCIEDWRTRFGATDAVSIAVSLVIILQTGIPLNELSFMTAFATISPTLHIYVEKYYRENE